MEEGEGGPRMGRRALASCVRKTLDLRGENGDGGWGKEGGSGFAERIRNHGKQTEVDNGFPVPAAHDIRAMSEIHGMGSRAKRGRDSWERGARGAKGGRERKSFRLYC